MKLGLFGFYVFFLPFVLLGQQKKSITIDNANEIQRIESRNSEPIRLLKGKVQITDEKTTIECDTAIEYSTSKKIELFKNITITSDTTTIKGDRGIYFLDKKMFNLEENVSIKTKNFNAKSRELTHYKKDAVTILSEYVYLKSEKGYTLCDTLTHYNKQKMAIARKNVIVVRDSDHVFIYGDSLAYYEKGKKSIVTDNKEGEATLLKIYTSSEKKKDKDKGKSVDKKNPIKNDTTKVVKETKKDTLFIYSKKMISYDEPKNEKDTARRIETIKHVQLIRNDISAIADTMIYYLDKKIIYLFGDVVLWKDDMQASGDKSVIFLKELNGQMDIKKVEIKGKVFVLSKDSLDKTNKKYNQSTGKFANLYFADSSKLYKMELISQATSVYHLYQKKTPKGATKITADTIKFFIENDKIKKVEGIGGIQGSKEPESKIKTSPLYLDKFKLRDNDKPKKKLLRKKIAILFLDPKGSLNKNNIA